MLKINSSDVIESIYVSTTAVTDAQILSSTDSGYLDIVFLRPNLNAFFCYKVLVSDLCTNVYGGNQISNINVCCVCVENGGKPKWNNLCC